MSRDRRWLALPLVGLVLLVLLLSLATITYRQHREIVALRARQQPGHVGQADLGNGTTRADSGQTAQDILEAIVAEGGLDLGGVEADAKTRGERLTAGHVTRATTPGASHTALPSSRSERLPELPSHGQTDTHGRLSRREYLELVEPLGKGPGAPWGTVGFAAGLEAPWSLQVHPRAYYATTAVTVDDDGRRTGYATLSIDVQGKRYKLPIAESTYREVLPTARFRFSPTLHLGLAGGVAVRPSFHGELQPDLSLAFFSYGMTRVLPDWSFLALGVAWQSVASAPALVLTPVAWNAGGPLPLLTNLYLGPSVSVSAGGDVAVLLGIRAAL